MKNCLTGSRAIPLSWFINAHLLIQQLLIRQARLKTEY
jgi:hypothetical protein